MHPDLKAARRRLPAAKRKFIGLLVALLIGVGLAYADPAAYLRVGRQTDGSFVVSTLQRVEPGAIAFGGRPIDMALHPSGAFMAVLNQRGVLLVAPEGVIPGSNVPLGDNKGAGFRGAVWSPNGTRLFVSVAEGYVQEFGLLGRQLVRGQIIPVRSPTARGNVRPGGMAITRDGQRLFVAECNRNVVAEIDISANRWIREYPVQNLPFTVRLSEDERTLIVSNWGGREATEDDERAGSGSAVVVVDPRGASASGTVCLIRRGSGETARLTVGLHPTAIAVQGGSAYVTNAASDSLTEIDINAQAVVRTIPLHWRNMRLFGSMPCALVVRDTTAYVCNGGDNAVCEVDLARGKVRGFRPAGYYPLAIALDPRGGRAFVLNTKGNGSVRPTRRSRPGAAAADFQGTVSVVDLNADLNAATQRVADNNGWYRSRANLRPPLAVYRGAIKHVLYIIKENRSYDEILGDMPQGNGDPRLCYLGGRVTPNHHYLAGQFTLFDNAYVSGTNSADGHQWCTQALANDYIEHFFTGYRTYPFDGTDGMAISSGGCLWDAALRKGRTVRDYGEFCDAKLASFSPPVKTWLEVWRDRASGKNRIESHAGTRIASIRPYINRRVLCWPLLQSDQERADIFIAEYNKLSQANRVPNLTFLTLPCDHTVLRDPDYPKPQCMVADNDLALGRVVEAVSKSPQWADTCIFVIEDDAQFGLDHVDGHRTVCFALSPYTRRAFVDHEMCNTVSLIRSIELMLGLDPMNRFDALTPPLADCFMDTPNVTVYNAIPNMIPLDDMNLPANKQVGMERRMTERSVALDWSAPDRADAKTVSRILWHTIRGVAAPYPSQSAAASEAFQDADADASEAR